VFERFTDKARGALVFAQDEARLLNHNFIGTEHILLGLLRESDGVAAKALASLDVDLETVRQKVTETVGPGSAPPAGSPPFTPRSKKVLEQSLREAMQLGHSYIGTEHLLLGLVREGEGVGAKVLTSLGAGLEAVRERVIDLLSVNPGAEQAGVLGARTRGGGLLGNQPPLCPYCLGALAGHLQYTAILATTADREGGGAVEWPIAYCDQCGRALGSMAGGTPAGQA
jgi:ATP-dependent Clp protease ATP-binding subunit ClpC